MSGISTHPINPGIGVVLSILLVEMWFATCTTYCSGKISKAVPRQVTGTIKETELTKMSLGGKGTVLSPAKQDGLLPVKTWR